MKKLEEAERMVSEVESTMKRGWAKISEQRALAEFTQEKPARVRKRLVDNTLFDTEWERIEAEMEGQELPGRKERGENLVKNE
jgi:tellurite resistance protein